MNECLYFLVVIAAILLGFWTVIRLGPKSSPGVELQGSKEALVHPNEKLVIWVTSYAMKTFLPYILTYDGKRVEITNNVLFRKIVQVGDQSVTLSYGLLETETLDIYPKNGNIVVKWSKGDISL